MNEVSDPRHGRPETQLSHDVTRLFTVFLLACLSFPPYLSRPIVGPKGPPYGRIGRGTEDKRRV